MTLNKAILFSTIKDRLLEKRLLYEAEMLAAQEEANYHKVAMESRYDTFKEEAQALKDGLAKQHSEVVSALSKIAIVEYSMKEGANLSTKARVGSIVKLLENGNTDSIFNYCIFVNVGTVVVGDVEYITIGADSPLGKALIGHEVGDEILFLGKTIEVLELY